MVRNRPQRHGIFNIVIIVYQIAKVGLNKINFYLSRADVSMAVCILVECAKNCLESAYSVRNKFPANNYDIPDDFMSIYIVPVVRKYPDTTYYTYNYVLPSFQFTALFQIGGVGFFLFKRSAYTATKLTLLKGGVKAGSSLLIIVKGKIAKGEDIQMSDFIIPFSKEPVVSLCKVGFSIYMPHFPTIAQKFSCNVLGETSHNAAKYAAGRQKLSLTELTLSIAAKSVVKTAHQEVEGGLTEKLGNVVGFYVGSFIPRSWANDFIEEATTGNLQITDINLESNITSYVGAVVLLAGTVHAVEDRTPRL